MTPQTFSCFILILRVCCFSILFSFFFCQIALAFLCWMLISVGFYFGLQKKNRTKNSKAIFYANNTTYFTLFHFIIIISFGGGGGGGGGEWAFLFCFCCCCYDITLKSPSLRTSQQNNWPSVNNNYFHNPFTV